MTSDTASHPTYLHVLLLFATTFICHMLTSRTCLLFSVSPHFLTTPPFHIAPRASRQSFFFLPVLSSASCLPLCHLPCRTLTSSIFLRLIAAQNDFVVIQQHPHESFPRSIPLLLWNSDRLHRFIPRFLIHGFRPRNEIDRLYFPRMLVTFSLTICKRLAYCSVALSSHHCTYPCSLMSF